MTGNLALTARRWLDLVSALFGGDMAPLGIVRKSRRLLVWLATLVGVAGLSVGCVINDFTRGNYPTDWQIDQLELNKTTRPQVREILGSPAIESRQDPDFWFYIGQDIEERSVLGQSVVGQRVFMVRFGGDLDRVQQFRRFDIGNDDVVRPLNKETEVTLRERNALQAVFDTIAPGGNLL